MSTSNFPLVPGSRSPSHPASHSSTVDSHKPAMVFNMDELLTILENALQGRLPVVDPEAERAAFQADLPTRLRTLDVQYMKYMIAEYWDKTDLQIAVRDSHFKLHYWLAEKITKFLNQIQSVGNNRMEGRQSLVCERLQRRVPQGDPPSLRSELRSYPSDLRSKYYSHFRPLFSLLFTPALDKYFDPILDPRPSLAIMAGFPEGTNPINNAHASSSANQPSAVMNPADQRALLLARIKELEMEQSGILVRKSVSVSSQSRTSKQSKLRKPEPAAAAKPIDISATEQVKAGKAKQIDEAAKVDNKTSIQVLIQLVMKAADRRGFPVSADYAELFLGRNDNKIIGAIDAIEADLEKREQALMATGRVPYHRHVDGRGPAPRDGFTRDEAIRFLEDDDRRLQACGEHGMKSPKGFHVMGIKPHLLAAFRAHKLEVAYRNERSQLYKRMADSVASGSIPAQKMSEALNDFDRGKTKPAYLTPDSDIQDGAEGEEQFPATRVERASEMKGDEAEAEAEAEDSDGPTVTKAELFKELEEVCELTNELAEKQTETISAAAAEMTLPGEFPFPEDIARMSKERQATELTRLANFMESLKAKAAADVQAGRR